jgi:phosphatidylserine decarboxylase
MTAGAAGWVGALAGAVALLPLVWKWQLGMPRCIVGLVTIAFAGGAAALAVGVAAGLSAGIRALLGPGLTVLAASATLAYRFYRDPERVPPGGDGLVVSPADGEVVYVKRSRDGRLPVASKHGAHVALEELTHTPVHERDAVVIGIAMSFLDVHVNRAPIAGRVLLSRHCPGRFGSLRRPEMVFQNERTTTLIRGNELEVAVVQIASRLVRQIGSYVSEGDEVSLGQRIGIIRLGSQVDVVIPHRRDLCVLVSEGDRVSAGSSVIATIGVTPVSAGASGRTAVILGSL